jgi:hypothetical protein
VAEARDPVCRRQHQEEARLLEGAEDLVQGMLQLFDLFIELIVGLVKLKGVLATTLAIQLVQPAQGVAREEDIDPFLPGQGLNRVVRPIDEAGENTVRFEVRLGQCRGHHCGGEAAVNRRPVGRLAREAEASEWALQALALHVVIGPVAHRPRLDRGAGQGELCDLAAVGEP